MVLSTAFNPLFATAIAAMYQHGEQQRISSMHAYYQSTQVDYGNRVEQNAPPPPVPYGPLLPAAPSGSTAMMTIDPFGGADMNLCQPTAALYGYGQHHHQQQQQLHQHQLMGSVPSAHHPFAASSPSATSYKFEPPFHSLAINVGDGHASSDIRKEDTSRESAAGLQMTSGISDTSTGGEIKGSTPFLVASGHHQQPSAAPTPPCLSYAPSSCHVYPPAAAVTGRGQQQQSVDMDGDGGVGDGSPPAYFYQTGRSSANAQYAAVKPPSTGFYFHPSATSSAVHQQQQFPDSGQLGLPVAPDYPWMKSKFQPPQASYPGNMTNTSASAMEIGAWCNSNSARTRTRDKYRMVYTDGQRLELEKEFITSEYISTQRKAYLSRVLGLSERQIKIWFQNRRAKKRKQSRRTDNPISGGASANNNGGGTNHHQQQAHLHPLVSSTSDFRALAASLSDDGDLSRRHSLEDISGSPGPFL